LEWPPRYALITLDVNLSRLPILLPPLVFKKQDLLNDTTRQRDKAVTTYLEIHLFILVRPRESGQKYQNNLSHPAPKQFSTVPPSALAFCTACHMKKTSKVVDHEVIIFRNDIYLLIVDLRISLFSSTL
jgi:hypothetical protein